jgi:hypothetical protein
VSEFLDDAQERLARLPETPPADASQTPADGAAAPDGTTR